MAVRLKEGTQSAAQHKGSTLSPLYDSVDPAEDRMIREAMPCASSVL